MRRRGRCAQDVEYQRPVLLPLLFPAASTHETRGCERPVPRTGLSRTPSLSSTTLSATARSVEHLIRLTCAVAYSCADSILFVPY